MRWLFEAPICRAARERKIEVYFVILDLLSIPWQRALVYRIDPKQQHLRVHMFTSIYPSMVGSLPERHPQQYVWCHVLVSANGCTLEKNASTELSQRWARMQS